MVLGVRCSPLARARSEWCNLWIRRLRAFRDGGPSSPKEEQESEHSARCAVARARQRILGHRIADPLTLSWPTALFSSDRARLRYSCEGGNLVDPSLAGRGDAGRSEAGSLFSLRCVP